MTAQAKRLFAWFKVWKVIKPRISQGELSMDATELRAALLALAED